MATYAIGLDYGTNSVRTLIVPGSLEVDVRDLVGLRPGNVLTLERLTGEPLEITVNGTPIALGEVRVHGERFAIRVTEILKAPRRDTNPEEVRRAETGSS